MSKYEKLWSYIEENGTKSFCLTFDEIAQIAGVPLDHSFLTYKKELEEFGWKVAKISMKNKNVFFEKIEEMKRGEKMLKTQRLILRKWTESDAESLFEYAKNPEVGPSAGWPPHKSVEESKEIIKNVLNGAECYALCEKENNIAIGSVELKLNGHTDMTERDDECELGYWLAQPFWGRGYMPEAAGELLRRAFEKLGMTTVWCGYYDGNQKSKRVQEKLGFVFHHTCNEVSVPLLNEVRVGHTTVMTKEHWEEIYK